MPRALLSVSDKSGLAEFALGLAELGYELFSTGGTLKALGEAGLEVHPVSDLTGFPEIMDGRIKTLHPGVHAGLLARRDKPEHLAALEEHGLRTIDLLCVNLYPFVETATADGVGFAEVIENIDIGGPAMIRSAAKNHASVAVVVRPEQYPRVLEGLATGGLPAEFRRQLAAEAYSHTALYDSAVSGWLREEPFPPELPVAGRLVQVLRYGENPHQSAAFYRLPWTAGGLAGAKQLQGGELSYNNIQDAAAAFALAAEFAEPAAAIIKHTNPCGCAIGTDLADAYRRAYECDTVSAYGGVVALNRPLDREAAERIAAIFVEVVIAPGFHPEGLDAMARRPKVRLLEALPVRSPWPELEFRSVPGGFLAQTPDREPFSRERATVPTRRQPTAQEWEQLAFAWKVVKHVKSNAIVVAREGAAVGVGAGQMSRVESVELALRRAGERARGTVLASDAFFPFPDGVEAAIAAGVTAIAQPGGSVRDQDSIAAADRAGVAMVMTGIRHFRH
ncbi:MAG TPA: bifunctional phosphoribosylaminoimidazolecarboxamide formyltransferase/IMP cyclohydrolase [Candidatus Dormibacteraeota bacterium]|nr:bifunctional phosphoribosylaminoimidazolecarboxamide formyltransferase/IMP cyclohydrolase [Candidatus Dormibacteraeota bacterium]